jgi:hypothetical protein
MRLCQSPRDESLTSMRIAQISTLYESVPSRRYGGIERVVSWLTEELVKMGHDVTLFASADSRAGARLVPGAACAVRLVEDTADPQAFHFAMLEDVTRASDAFDIVHFHTGLSIHPPAEYRARDDAALACWTCLASSRCIDVSPTCRSSQSRMHSASHCPGPLGLPRCITVCRLCCICSARGRETTSLDSVKQHVRFTDKHLGRSAEVIVACQVVMVVAPFGWSVGN